MTDQPSTQPLPPDRDQEILAVNQSMLESVMAGDWGT